MSFRTLLMLCWLKESMSLCPSACHCTLDMNGRRQVICSKGGMSGTIPVKDMDLKVEVLKITAPEDNENSLTIGPIFHEMQRLNDLEITFSNLPAIGMHSFWGVPSLKHLNLTFNNISQVLEHNFRGLANLLELNLDGNRIESMGSETFHHLPELRKLTLSDNRITHLSPRLFLMLGKLRHLDLSYNDLEHLDPEVFKDVQGLRVLSCRMCRLRKMNPYIYSLLPSLTNLDIGENEFKYLDPLEFRDLRKLQVLLIDGNHFPVILDNSFASQTHLKILNLARNRIAKITTLAFENLTSLVELDLSYNKLDKLEAATVQPLVDTLRMITITGNNIDVSDFHYTVQLLTKLKELSIAELGISNSNLPLGLLSRLDSLKFLNMSGNTLVQLPVQFLSPVMKLAELDLSRNHFHGLSERLIIRLKNVKVHLDGNPWACDLCHIAHMVRSMNDTLWAREAVCEMPHYLKGEKLGNLELGSLNWCGSDLGFRDNGIAGLALTHNTQIGLIAAGAAIALLVITMAAIVAGLLYNRHHAAYYYTNEHHQRRCNGGPHSTSLEKEKICPQSVEKKVSIATIDEITKDPELQILAGPS